MSLFHSGKPSDERAKDARADEIDAELSFDAPESDSDFESGIFINSVESLREDDITLNESARRSLRRASPLEWIRRIMFWFFLVAFIVSFCLLIQNLIAKQKASRIYSQIQDEFFSTGFSFDVSDVFREREAAASGLTEDREQRSIRSMTELLESGGSAAEAGTVEGHKDYNEELEKMRAGLRSLALQNPDIYGWITVPGTNINYPLVQGEDNDYYLNHAYNGDYLPVGSIFVDYRCNKSITKNFNTVFYGHNITSGDMFHDVTKFFRQEVFDNTLIYVYTMDGIFVYQPFSVYETRYDYQYFKVGFPSADDFIAFATELQENSEVKRDKPFTFTDHDRVLTLSTCTNGAFYARYALHAKLIRTILD